MQALIELVERGHVPQILIRVGIRRLHRQRLRMEGGGPCEQQLDWRREFLGEPRSGAVAATDNSTLPTLRVAAGG